MFSTKQMTNSKSGFTLVEVVIASGLLCLLVAASYVGISSVTHSARIMSQRVTAQGACIALLETMKYEYDQLANGKTSEPDSSQDDVMTKALELVQQGLGPGCKNMELSWEVEGAEGAPNRKNVKISCTWEFTDKYWKSGKSNLQHTEDLWSVITASASTYTQTKNLVINHMCLNPNYKASPKSYTLPSKLRIVSIDGTVYTQKNLADGTMPANVYARSVEVFPGGPGEQTPFTNKKEILNNAKSYAYYSRSDDYPLSISITSGSGKYYMDVQCSNASATIE